MQETGRLTKIPGIGKKTAERLLLELKDKLGADLTHGRRRASRRRRASSDVLQRAAGARLQRQGGASPRSSSCPTALAVGDGIRQALKLLAKA